MFSLFFLFELSVLFPLHDQYAILGTLQIGLYPVIEMLGVANERCHSLLLEDSLCLKLLAPRAIISRIMLTLLHSESASVASEECTPHL